MLLDVRQFTREQISVLTMIRLHFGLYFARERGRIPTDLFSDRSRRGRNIIVHRPHEQRGGD